MPVGPGGVDAGQGALHGQRYPPGPELVATSAAPAPGLHAAHLQVQGALGAHDHAGEEGAVLLAAGEHGAGHQQERLGGGVVHGELLDHGAAVGLGDGGALGQPGLQRVTGDRCVGPHREQGERPDLGGRADVDGGGLEHGAPPQGQPGRCRPDPPADPVSIRSGMSEP